MKRVEETTGTETNKKGKYKTPVLRKHGDVTSITLGYGSCAEDDFGFSGCIWTYTTQIT